MVLLGLFAADTALTTTVNTEIILRGDFSTEPLGVLETQVGLTAEWLVTEGTFCSPVTHSSWASLSGTVLPGEA